MQFVPFIFGGGKVLGDLLKQSNACRTHLLDADVVSQAQGLVQMSYMQGDNVVGVNFCAVLTSLWLLIIPCLAYRPFALLACSVIPMS